MHLAFFVVRYARTLKDLSLPAIPWLRIVARVSYAFTRSAVYLSLRSLFTPKI